MFFKYIIFIILISSSIFANSFKTNIFIKCDQNKDNHLNKKEYAKMSLKRFERFDISKDNQVDPKELSQTQLAKLMPQIAINWFIRNDINQNKIVTKQEAINASNIKFKTLDKNKDNLLDIKEWIGNL